MRISVIVLTFVLLSCSETKWERKAFIGKYTIEIPSYLKQTPSEHFSGIYFENPGREIYLNIDHGLQRDFESAGVLFDKKLVAHLMSSELGKDLVAPKIESETPLIIHEIPAYQLELSGKSQNRDVVYLVTVVSATPEYYVITSWMSGDKSDGYHEDVKRIASSFRLD